MVCQGRGRGYKPGPWRQAFCTSSPSTHTPCPGQRSQLSGRAQGSPNLAVPPNLWGHFVKTQIPRSHYELNSLEFMYQRPTSQHSGM